MNRKYDYNKLGLSGRKLKIAEKGRNYGKYRDKKKREATQEMEK